MGLPSAVSGQPRATDAQIVSSSAKPIFSIYSLMTAGDDKTWTFDAAVQYYHTLSQIFGGQDMGMCLAGGCVGCEEKERQISASYLEAAKELGKSL